MSLTSPGTELNSFIAERTTPALSGYATVLEIDRVGTGTTDLKPGDRVFHMGNHVSHQRAARADCLKLPAGLAPEVGVFARLMGVSWTTLVTTTARPADRVLVTGLGIVGNLAAQIFQSAGYRVVAVDPNAERRALATNAGAGPPRVASVATKVRTTAAEIVRRPPLAPNVASTVAPHVAPHLVSHPALTPA